MCWCMGGTPHIKILIMLIKIVLLKNWYYKFVYKFHSVYILKKVVIYENNNCNIFATNNPFPYTITE